MFNFDAIAEYMIKGHARRAVVVRADPDCGDLTKNRGWKTTALIRRDWRQNTSEATGNTMGAIAQAIERELQSWPGVTSAEHRFGGIEFRVGRRELGHLHGDRLADLPFPVKIREELVAAGKAGLHHVLPQSGWVSYRIHGLEDVPRVIELFKLNYDRATGRWKDKDR